MLVLDDFFSKVEKLSTHSFDNASTDSCHKAFDAFRPQRRQGKGGTGLSRRKQSNAFLQTAL